MMQHAVPTVDGFTVDADTSRNGDCIRAGVGSTKLTCIGDNYTTTMYSSTDCTGGVLAHASEPANVCRPRGTATPQKFFVIQCPSTTTAPITTDAPINSGAAQQAPVVAPLFVVLALLAMI